jgi:hypothetical protein
MSEPTEDDKRTWVENIDWLIQAWEQQGLGGDGVEFLLAQRQRFTIDAEGRK